MKKWNRKRTIKRALYRVVSIIMLWALVMPGVMVAAAGNSSAEEWVLFDDTGNEMRFDSEVIEDGIYRMYYYFNGAFMKSYEIVPGLIRVTDAADKHYLIRPFRQETGEEERLVLMPFAAGVTKNLGVFVCKEGHLKNPTINIRSDLTAARERLHYVTGEEGQAYADVLAGIVEGIIAGSGAVGPGVAEPDVIVLDMAVAGKLAGEVLTAMLDKAGVSLAEGALTKGFSDVFSSVVLEYALTARFSATNYRSFTYTYRGGKKVYAAYDGVAYSDRYSLVYTPVEESWTNQLFAVKCWLDTVGYETGIKYLGLQEMIIYEPD